MANNKIQILGKQIPTIENNSGGYPSSEDLYILTSNGVSPSDSRQLKAIKYDTLRRSIVGEKTASKAGDSVVTTSAINYVKSGYDFTLSASGQVPQIAFVVNTKAYPTNNGLINDSASTNSIKVTYNGTQITIPAQGVAIFETTTSGKYTNAISLTSFTEKYLSDIMGGKLVSTALKAKTLTLVNSDSTYVDMTVNPDSMITITGNK